MISSIAALRAVEHHLNLDKLYVLGTNCGMQKVLCFALNHLLNVYKIISL